MPKQLYYSVHFKEFVYKMHIFQRIFSGKTHRPSFCLGVGWKYRNSSFRLKKKAIISHLYLSYPKGANLAPVYTILSTAVTSQGNQVSIPPKPFASFKSSLGIDALREDRVIPAHTQQHCKIWSAPWFLHAWVIRIISSWTVWLKS